MIPKYPAFLFFIEPSVPGRYTNRTPHRISNPLFLYSIIKLWSFLLAVGKGTSSITARPAYGPPNSLICNKIYSCVLVVNTFLPTPKSLANLICVERLSFLYNFFFAVGVEKIGLGPTLPFRCDWTLPVRITSSDRSDHRCAMSKETPRAFTMCAGGKPR